MSHATVPLPLLKASGEKMSVEREDEKSKRSRLGKNLWLAQKETKGYKLNLKMILCLRTDSD